MTRMGTRKPRAGAWICHRVSGIRRRCPIGRHRYRTRRRTCPSGEDDVARLALGMGSPSRGARASRAEQVDALTQTEIQGAERQYTTARSCDASRRGRRIRDRGSRRAAAGHEPL